MMGLTCKPNTKSVAPDDAVVLMVSHMTLGIHWRPVH
jgi:hypothetical protein